MSRVPFNLDAMSIGAFHDRFLAGMETPAAQRGPWPWIAENHRRNAALWQEVQHRGPGCSPRGIPVARMQRSGIRERRPQPHPGSAV